MQETLSEDKSSPLHRKEPFVFVGMNPAPPPEEQVGYYTIDDSIEVTVFSHPLDGKTEQGKRIAFARRLRDAAVQAIYDPANINLGGSVVDCGVEVLGPVGTLDYGNTSWAAATLTLRTTRFVNYGD